MLFQTWVDSKTLNFGVGHTKTAEDITESKSLFDQLPVGFNVSLIQSTDIIPDNDLHDNHVVGRYRMCKTDLQTLTDSSWFNDLFIDCYLYLVKHTQVREQNNVPIMEACWAGSKLTQHHSLNWFKEQTQMVKRRNWMMYDDAHTMHTGYFSHYTRK